MAERYLAEGAYANIKDLNELHECTKYREEHDQWVMFLSNELGAIGVEDAPLLYPQECTNLSVPRNGYTVDVEDIDWQDAENAACIKESGLFITGPKGNKIVAFPTAVSALREILGRAGDEGKVMTFAEPKKNANRKPLPIKSKAARLCEDFSLSGEPVKALFRDGRLRALLTGGFEKDENGNFSCTGYVILPPDEMLTAFEQSLAVEHPDFVLDEATVSEEMIVARYYLNDEVAEDTITNKLRDEGQDVEPVRSGALYVNGECGDCAARAYVFIVINGVKVMLPHGIKMDHKGEASVGKFREECDRLGMSLKEAEDEIEELGNQEIDDPAAVVRKIVDNDKTHTYKKAIAKTVCDELALRCKFGGTAIDCYLALNEIVQRRADTEELDPATYAAMCEQVAQALFLPYQKIDSGADEW